jgi:hypothetical protein
MSVTLLAKGATALTRIMSKSAVAQIMAALLAFAAVVGCAGRPAPRGATPAPASKQTLTLTETHLLGNHVLVVTPFGTLLADPSTGRVERFLRDVSAPQLIAGTSLFIDRSVVRTRIIDGETLDSIVSWPGHAVSWQSADGALVAFAVAAVAGGDKYRIVVFDTRERRSILELPLPDVEAQVRFVDAGRILVIGGEARDARSGRLVFSQARDLGSPAFNGSYVAYVAPDRTVVLADRETWKPIAKTRTCAAAGPLAFDASGKWLAIGGEDGACVVDVPSLRVRRTHVARRLPVFQHPELEARLVNQVIPTFVASGHVLALTSGRTFEVSLFDTTTGRELSHDVGELFEPENSDAYVVTSQEPREVITVGSGGTIDRRTLSKEEYDRHWRRWSRVPEPEVVDRIRARLCRAGAGIVPREACDR